MISLTSLPVFLTNTLYGGEVMLTGKKQKGFTLLELMISMVIMAIAFLGILPFFFYSQSQIKQAIITNYAMNILQEKMERITHLDYGMILYDDQDGTPNEYIFVLPEARLSPCTGLPGGSCGYIPSTNLLRDYVERDGYFFTRLIDIDQPEDRNSLEEEDKIGPFGDNLPSDRLTKRINIQVNWTVPGGTSQFVAATTQVANITIPEFLN